MEEPNKKYRVKDLIALCNIIDDYEEFRDNLICFLEDNNNQIKKIANLHSISIGKMVIGDNSTKQFYKENKQTIDKINTVSCIYDFIVFNIPPYLDPFYHYLQAHRKDLDNILALLLKIEDLKIKYLSLDETWDFTKDIYVLYECFINYDLINSCTYGFVYLDNMVAIPNYPTDKISYKSKKSNYKIIKSPLETQILVNSLLFELSRLPDKNENFIKNILNLREEIEPQNEAIKKSVDLSVKIKDLEAAILDLEKTISRIHNPKVQEKLNYEINAMKNSIVNLKLTNEEYNQTIIANW